MPKTPSSRPQSEAAINYADMPVGQKNPWLLGYAALIGASTLAWSMWWPPIRPRETAADREVQHSATVIDLAAWRRRRAQQASSTGHDRRREQ
jgi:hypothetical protein